MKTQFNEFLKDQNRHRLYEQESLAFEAAELISSLMEEQGLKKSDLAHRIGKSSAYVTQVLSGSRNMTLHTFADLAFALGAKVGLSHCSLSKTDDNKAVSFHYPVSRSASSYHWPKHHPIFFTPSAMMGDERAHAA